MAPFFTGIARGVGGFGFGRSAEVGVPFSATGGTVTTYNGKTIHTFTASGTFEASGAPGVVEYLVVAGGGSGGYDDGGGGGAGGYLTGTTFISSGSVSVQVGSGGAGSGPPSNGSNGTPSYFGVPITATGGGKGGSSEPAGNTSGSPGGSGGG